MNAPSTIAIDGPAASGKSSLGDLLAAQLGYAYLDTGVMYRAVAWAVVVQRIAVKDEPAVTALAETLRIEITEPTTEDGRRYTALVDGRDVTWALREEAVEKAVSPVSEYRGVRHAMTKQQQRIAEPGRIVMVGRDIGTVVLPRAELKIYLKALQRVRARRRYLELKERGRPSTFRAAMQSVRDRDQIDRRRSEAPLKPAADAIVIDSTNLDAKQVLGMVCAIIEYGAWNATSGEHQMACGG